VSEEDIDFREENLFLLQRALALVEDLEVGFKNRTSLSKFCAHHMSAAKAGSPPINISTLTRNPIYRALLDKQLSSNAKGYELEVIALRLEVSNLRKSNQRKDLYIESLDNPPLEARAQTLPVPRNDLSSNYLVKIIDLLMDCFEDHIAIDLKTGEIVRPYITSSARVVVPKNIAKYYIKTKE
jgi:hypothetical protein